LFPWLADVLVRWLPLQAYQLGHEDVPQPRKQTAKQSLSLRGAERRGNPYGTTVALKSKQAIEFGESRKVNLAIGAVNDQQPVNANTPDSRGRGGYHWFTQGEKARHGKSSNK